MSAGISRAPLQENVSTTLSAGITDVATTMSVADASQLVEPCYLVIDRVDSAGTLKNTSLWEYVKVTGISSNDLTIERGKGGSTGQAHSSGAVVETLPTAAMFTEWYNALNPEHTASGGHIITGTMTISGMFMASAATVAIAAITSHAIANASYTGLGFGLFPTWYIPSLPSLPTTGLGRPVSMPRPGTLKAVSVTLSGIVSSPTVFFDVNKNFGSIFAPACRPLIANSTFVSTASIATANFNAGDILSVDYDIVDLGGNSVDATVTGIAY